MTQKQLYILSADDDRDDQDFIDEALKSTSIDHVFERVSDGDKLLKMLDTIHLSGKDFPDVILLDLNMPIKSGREAIKIIKSETSHFKEIPVVILTTSSASEDVNYCLKHGAHSFLVKPTGFDELVDLLNTTIHKVVNPSLS